MNEPESFLDKIKRLASLTNAPAGTTYVADGYMATPSTVAANGSASTVDALADPSKQQIPDALPVAMPKNLTIKGGVVHHTEPIGVIEGDSTTGFRGIHIASAQRTKAFSNKVQAAKALLRLHKNNYSNNPGSVKG